MHDTLSVPPGPVEELRQEVERLRLLHSISLEFNASLDFDELLPRVFDRVIAALGAEGGSLWITEGEILRCRLATAAAASGSSERDAGGDGIRRRRGPQAADDHGDGSGPRPRFQQATDAAEDSVSSTVMATRWWPAASPSGPSRW
jgi:hypothetical protein